MYLTCNCMEGNNVSRKVSVTKERNCPVLVSHTISWSILSTCVLDNFSEM